MFASNLFEYGDLTESEWNVYQDWHRWILKEFEPDIALDGIIYLRAQPQVLPLLLLTLTLHLQPLRDLDVTLTLIYKCVLKCPALTKVLYTMELDLIPIGRSFLSFGSTGYTDPIQNLGDKKMCLSWSR